MSLITPHNIFMTTMWGGIIFLATGPAIFLALHFLMPKQFLEKYFTSPFFQIWEINAFNIFPSTFMRTVMLTGVIAFPKLGKKRKLTDAHLDAPRWYKIFSKTYWIYFLTLGGLFVISLFGLVAYTVAIDNL